MRRMLVALTLVVGLGGVIGVGALAMVFSLSSRSGGGEQNCVPGLAGDAGRGHRDAASLSQESRHITGRIIEIGKQRGLPPRAWQIAIQAGKTESNLANVQYGDRDSLGIFQMRPSMGWGSPTEVTNVDYAINKFYTVLLTIPNWEQLRPGEAAQKVEKSAFPMRYHRWESMAAHLISTHGQPPSGGPVQAGPAAPPAPAGAAQAQFASSSEGCESAPASEVAQRAIGFAESQLGKPYIWGAAGPDAFDCSGLTQQAWKTAGVGIPKYSQTQFHLGGKHIPLAQAQPGDLVFWGYGRSPNGVHHVALYLGNNDILHAPEPGKPVQRAKLWDGGELLPVVVRPSERGPMDMEI